MGDRQRWCSSSSWARSEGPVSVLSEREQIAMSRAAGESVRSIATRLGRRPSTISRELRRNQESGGGYRASSAVGAKYLGRPFLVLVQAAWAYWLIRPPSTSFLSTRSSWASPVMMRSCRPAGGC